MTRRPRVSPTSTDLSATCTTNGHRWTPAFATGEYLCRRCGLLALCPGCQPVVPIWARITYCAAHRQEERREP